MLLLTKRYLTLAAAVMMVAGLSTGCSAKKSSTGGNAKVTVTASAVVVADINHIDLTITGGAGEAGFPITATLSKASTGKEWTVNITNIPAGTGRLFHAVAYKAPGTAAADKIFEGESTPVVIMAGATAQVAIMLQELNVPPGQTNYAPAITSLSYYGYVMPGARVSFALGANDPDHNGDPLHTSWSASCTTGGNGTFSAAASAATDWTAPAQNATCTIAVTVTESATFPPALPNNNGVALSVTTYFTVTVNGNFGNVDVAAFPNSFPIVTARADTSYSFTVMPVGQQADFAVDAIDPDGDNVRYDLKAQCGSDLVAAASAAALDPSFFTTTTSIMGTPSSWLPKFGVAPAASYTDPNQDCIFTITVQDLCTAGNCGGALADGADKATQIAGVEVKSFVTVIINATHPAQPKSAPTIVHLAPPNQLGPVATGVQGFYAEKVVIVEPSKLYTFGAEAADPELGTLTVQWSCAVGSVGTAVNTGNLKSEMTWTAPASLAAGMTCTATFTSSASSLSTVATFKLSGSDECLVNAWAAGHACSTGNACITGETCQPAAGGTTLCGAGSAVVCPVTDGQCQDAVCSPVSGCSVNNRSDSLACNADLSGCTQGDHCSAGACVQGAAVTCSTPVDAQCQSAAGMCSSTGDYTHVCNYPSLTNGTACNFDNTGCTANDSCLAGACTAGTPVTCTQTANVCQASTGMCTSTDPTAYSCNFANLNGTTCNTAGLCVTGQSCLDGTCQGGTPTCPAGQSCTPATGNCVASVVAPVVARDLQLSPPSGIAMDSSGSTLVAGNIFTNVDVNFQTRLGGAPILVRSLGGIDGFLAKYDAAGDITWAVTVADDDPVSNTNDQTATNAAVTANGTVATIGKIVGSVTYGSSNISAASALPYVGAFASTDGARLWAKGYNLGSNGAFRAIAASPSNAQNRIAVCGSTNIAATQLVTGAALGGLTDLVVAVFDSNGNKLWASQLGGTGNESCTSVTIDDNGDVYAAGQFDGASLTFPGTTPTTLTGPGTTTRKFMWVAKFAGAGDGAGHAGTLAAVAYSGTTGTATPNGLAIGPAGDLVVGGQFAGNLTIGAAMTVSGGDDAFVAKLDGITLAPVWNAVRFGGTGLDLVKSVAVTSFGDIVVTGTFNPSTSAFKTANGGFDTNGAVSLNTSGTTASDMFVAKLNGGTGATDDADAYGDLGTQNGDGIVVNRFGGNQVTFVGTLMGTADFGGAAGAVTAAGGTDAVLVFSHLQ